LGLRLYVLPVLTDLARACRAAFRSPDRKLFFLSGSLPPVSIPLVNPGGGNAGLASCPCCCVLLRQLQPMMPAAREGCVKDLWERREFRTVSMSAASAQRCSCQSLCDRLRAGTGLADAGGGNSTKRRRCFLTAAISSASERCRSHGSNEWGSLVGFPRVASACDTVAVSCSPSLLHSGGAVVGD